MATAPECANDAADSRNSLMASISHCSGSLPPPLLLQIGEAARAAWPVHSGARLDLQGAGFRVQGDERLGQHLHGFVDALGGARCT